MLQNYTVLKLLLKYYGLKEKAKGFDTIILNWVKSFFPKVKDDSEYSWCSIGLISILSENEEFRAQIKDARIDPMARSWNRLPSIIYKLEDALPGDIIILTRGNGLSGHVGVFVGMDISNKNQINILGCNQGDAVSIASFDKSRIIGIRRLIKN
ncbi:MAG TPA: hypothetical protein PKD00_06090 [Burkholderiales bacterium]|nr:hypothetical protein [Burkholderiales bacterium]